MYVFFFRFCFDVSTEMQRHLLVIHMDWILAAAVTFEQSIQFYFFIEGALNVMADTTRQSS